MDQEDRIALFLDYENLALGARDHLGGMAFDLLPVTDALAERGRVVVRRAYADWSYFDDDRRALTRSHVELIDIPQRMGASRKNAADIKMAVDVLVMSFERDYISTFVLCTGDSDFTPLVHKLRELNKRVIGVGVEQSTSALLPPACDEFLFYDRLEGVEPSTSRRRRGGGRGGSQAARRGEAQARLAPDAPAAPTAAQVPTTPAAVDAPPAVDTAARRAPEDAGAGRAPEPADLGRTTAGPAAPERDGTDGDQLAVLIAQTVAGLQSGLDGPVTASILKRTLLRKDPTFSEADHGFRAFGELLRHLAVRNVIELSDGPAKGDPEVSLPEHGDREEAFRLLRTVVAELVGSGQQVALSGLKDQVRRARPDFSEKKLGYRSFLQFCRAAATDGVVALEWSPDADDYVVTLPPAG